MKPSIDISVEVPLAALEGMCVLDHASLSLAALDHASLSLAALDHASLSVADCPQALFR